MAGDSPDIEFFMMTPDDYRESMELLHIHYVYRNPLCKACGETSHNTYTEPLMSDVRKCLTSGASVGVRHKASKTLAGVFLNLPLNLDEMSTQNITDNLGTEYRVLRRLSADTKVFQELNVHRVLDLFILCVHESYGGRGLGSKLMKKSLSVGTELGYQMARVMSTNSVTEKISTRLGFHTVKTLDLITIADELSIDTSLIPGETDMKMMIKQLSCNTGSIQGSTSLISLKKKCI